MEPYLGEGRETTRVSQNEHEVVGNHGDYLRRVLALTPCLLTNQLLHSQAPTTYIRWVVKTHPKTSNE